MGYAAGSVCAHKGGASMSHIHPGNILRRAMLVNLMARDLHMSHAAASPCTSLSSILSLNTCRKPRSLRRGGNPIVLNVSPALGPLPCLESASLGTGLFRNMVPYGNHVRHVEITSIKPRLFPSLLPLGKHLLHSEALLNTRQTMHHYGSGLPKWRSLSLASDSHEMFRRLDVQSLVPAHEDLDFPAERSSNAKKSVVVVESPAKAKTIQKYLGADYTVLPTYGHVRDLAAKAGSVRPDEDYEMVWEVPEAAENHLTRIRDALKGAESLILASDPDREGEAIAWHVSELMKAGGLVKGKKTNVVRVSFNEMTKTAILRAMEAPRDLSETLVTAYLARRALDHLIGFALSPVLWRKLPGSRSARRVQSVALKLVCEREKEIEEFEPQEYWTVEAFAQCEGVGGKSGSFEIRPTHFDGKKIEKFFLSSEDAKLLSEKLSNVSINVTSIRKNLRRKYPPQPYITSTLQQDAQFKLGYGAVRTMTLAQKLYEGVKLENQEPTGLITYMRTDGLQLSNEAVDGIRDLVSKRYGEKYLPAGPRKFISKVKNAQEAHEAIRPTDVHRLPSQLCDVLDKDALLLYTLIWRRTVSCQMEHAIYEEVSVDFAVEGGSICLRASGNAVVFPGFLAAMEDKDAAPGVVDEVLKDVSRHDESSSDETLQPSQKYGALLTLKEGDVVVITKTQAQQHFTHPPARYSEGFLVKAMEELGIGRPSTYASILKTLESRKYVRIENHRIIPEVRGRMVVAFLMHYFPKYIDYNFTAHMEEQLDEVSGGRMDWKDVLKGFWPEFKDVVTSSMKVPIDKIIAMLQETFADHCFKGLGVNGQMCPSCGRGRLSLRLSRFGSGYFFGCDSYPDCSFKAELLGNEGAESAVKGDSDCTVLLKKIEKFDMLIGVDPATNLEVRIKNGPFGYYLQLGEEGNQRHTFKIPKRINPTDVTLESAKEIMKYPMVLGNHPEDGDLVTVGIAKKGFFVRHRGSFATLPKGEAPDVTLEKALSLLRGKTARHRGRRRLAAIELTEKHGAISEKKKKTARSQAQKGTAEVPVEAKASKVTKTKLTSTKVGYAENGEVLKEAKNDKVVTRKTRKPRTATDAEKEGLEEEAAEAPKQSNVSRGRKKAMTAIDDDHQSHSDEKEIVKKEGLQDEPPKQSKVSGGRQKAATAMDDDNHNQLEAREASVKKKAVAGDLQAVRTMGARKPQDVVGEQGHATGAMDQQRVPRGRKKAAAGSEKDDANQGHWR